VAEPQARLVLFRGDEPAAEFALDPRQPTAIGRSSQNAIQLRDPKLSRRHCEIRPTPEGYFIRDLGSRNGTFVNGARVREARLRDGDRIQVGLARFAFHCEASQSTAATELAPPTICAACAKIIPLETLSEARRTAHHLYCAACVAANPILGTTLGGHEIVQPIGSGTVGVVFKAEQLSVARPVALKVIHSRLAANGDLLAHVLRGAKEAGQLTHPHIARIFDVNEAGGRHFISMEFAEEGDAASLVEREGPLSVAAALEVAIATASALAHAHARGILHRAVKPTNLLLARDGIPKLTDIGLVPPAPPRALQPSALPFLAPEQLREDRRVDGRADIYSLAATCYLLLTGQPPRRVARPSDLAKSFTIPPMPIRSFRADVPEHLERALARAMEIEPTRRFQTAEDFLDALKAVRL